MATIETVMLSDLEIYRAVQDATCRYDDDAALHAAQRADEMMVEGDMEGRAVWHRIERAIDELCLRSRSTRPYGTSR